MDKILIKNTRDSRAKLTLEDYYKIIENRHRGIPITKTCKELKISDASVSKTFKRAGIYFLNSSYFDYSTWTEDKIQELINDFNAGIPVYKLVNKYGFHKNSLAKIINENGGNTTPVSFNSKFFECINTEEKAYWLGFLYADGAVSSRDNNVEISLQLLDAAHLYKYKRALCSKSSIRLDFKIGRCRINVCNKYFKQSLITNGCTPKKSLTLSFKCKDIENNSKLKIAFIRGYFDGDGCLTHTYSDTKKKRFTISCRFIGTAELLQWINSELNSNNIVGTWYKDKKYKNNTTELCFNKTNSVKLLDLLYSNSSIHLDRKYKKYLFFKKHENFAVYVSDYIEYNRAISEEAKQWVNNYFNIDYDSLHANAEITKKSNEFLAS